MDICEWSHTTQALLRLRETLNCGICSDLLREPCTLGSCDPLFCRQCIGDHVGNPCPLCQAPSFWAKELQVKRELANVVKLYAKMCRLINPSPKAPSHDDAIERDETSQDESMHHFEDVQDLGEQDLIPDDDNVEVYGEQEDEVTQDQLPPDADEGSDGINDVPEDVSQQSLTQNNVRKVVKHVVGKHGKLSCIVKLVSDNDGSLVAESARKKQLMKKSAKAKKIKKSQSHQRQQSESSSSDCTTYSLSDSVEETDSMNVFDFVASPSRPKPKKKRAARKVDPKVLRARRVAAANKKWSKSLKVGKRSQKKVGGSQGGGRHVSFMEDSTDSDTRKATDYLGGVECMDTGSDSMWDDVEADEDNQPSVVQKKAKMATSGDQRLSVQKSVPSVDPLNAHNKIAQRMGIEVIPTESTSNIKSKKSIEIKSAKLSASKPGTAEVSATGSKNAQTSNMQDSTIITTNKKTTKSIKLKSPSISTSKVDAVTTIKEPSFSPAQDKTSGTPRTVGKHSIKTKSPASNKNRSPRMSKSDSIAAQRPLPDTEDDTPSSHSIKVSTPTVSKRSTKSPASNKNRSPRVSKADSIPAQKPLPDTEDDIPGSHGNKVSTPTANRKSKKSITKTPPKLSISPVGKENSPMMSGASPGRGSSKRNIRGETPLHLAAIKGDAAALEELLKDGSDANVKDNAGWMPLHESCNHGHADCVALLLDHGALINAPGFENDSPLHDAITNNRVDVARLLVERGASLKVRNKHGLTPGDYARTDELKAALNVTPLLTSSPSMTVLKAQPSMNLPPVILATGLGKTQKNKLDSCAKLLKGRIVNSFSPEVTHLVASCNADGVCMRTIKYLQAILTGKWVVNYSWVLECLKKKKRVDEGRHEVPGTTSHPTSNGPSSGRDNVLNQFPGLFDGCNFFFYGIFKPPTPSKSELSGLIKSGGGAIVQRQPKPDDDVIQTSTVVPYHAADDSQLANCSYYIIYDPTATKVPPKVNTGKVRSAPVTWLMDCISTFTLMDIKK